MSESWAQTMAQQSQAVRSPGGLLLMLRRLLAGDDAAAWARAAHYEAALREIDACLCADPYGSRETVVRCARVVARALGREAGWFMLPGLSGPSAEAARPQDGPPRWTQRRWPYGR